MTRLDIRTEEKRFPVAQDLYGVFFEDISRSGDGGLYPEMLRNRSFEDSLLPEGCQSLDGGKTFVSPTGWHEEFNNGEGMNDWLKRNKPAPTDIPAWYSENAFITLEKEDTLNCHRKAALRASFGKDGLIYNTGFYGVAQEKGKEYRLTLFIKTEKPVTLTVSVEENGHVLSSACLSLSGQGFRKYECSLKAAESGRGGVFCLRAPVSCTLLLGFSSLMPADTFRGHGLRRDLGEKLCDLHPGFLRFPGGCIVEGFTKETVMYFKNTVGPVEERPSHWLVWHYRTTNGLGFHEYLQLCEDLGASPLYVVNCGMTCQGRGPYYMTNQEQGELLEDILGALEYALGDKSTPWGALRAKMGHEAPFSLKYLEIGNENSGEKYEKCYERIRSAVHSRYPSIRFISNERSEKINADIIDEHFYNMPEFYAAEASHYDDYDRKKPDIFVGEFSVNQTYEGQLRAAVAEAMFMLGFERNQDKVKLCSYAPLFEHVHFYSWFPNLILYDNARSFAIPSYYVFRMFGQNRGKNVVFSRQETGKLYRDLKGLPMVTGDERVTWKNARFNGKAVLPERELIGSVKEEGDGSFTLDASGFTPPPERKKPWAAAALGTDITAREGSFEAEVLSVPGRAFGIGILCAPKPLSFYDRMLPVPRDPWEMFNLEPIRFVIKDGYAAAYSGGLMLKKLTGDIPVTVKENAFNLLRCDTDACFARFFLNGEQILCLELPHCNLVETVVTDDEEQILVKIVNFGDKEEKILITLDTDVESSYSNVFLTGEAHAENSFENPEHVRDREEQLNGASRKFTHIVPALSANVLRLRKKQG